MIEPELVYKINSQIRGITVYKRNKIFDYKVLREIPLCYLDEEEFRFVKKTLLDARPEEGCSICQ